MTGHPKQPAIDAANYLFNTKGIPRDGAIAVASCLYYESSLKPGSQGHQATEHGGIINRGGAYGIASWNGPADQSKVGDPLHDRQAALKAFAESKSLPVENVETQLYFVLNEAANSYLHTWETIRSTLSYREIIPVFVHDYENPADHAKEAAAALAIADEIEPFVVRPLKPPVPLPAPAPQPAPTAPASPTAPLPPPAWAPPSPAGAPGPAPAPAPPHVLDKELLAIGGCYAILDELDATAQHRVLVYLYARFVGP